MIDNLIPVPLPSPQIFMDVAGVACLLLPQGDINRAAQLCELKFVNSDATPKTVILRVSAASVASIMAWYGAYFARDRYTVSVNGKRVEKDQNGELVSPCEGSDYQMEAS